LIPRPTSASKIHGMLKTAWGL